MPDLWVRTRLDHASFLAAVRSEVKQTLPKTTEPNIGWLAQDLYASSAGKRLYAGCLSALAGLGLFLAALGIYGVLSHMVTRRIREIGVRMALGAERRDIIQMIVSQGGRLMGLGILSRFGFAYLVSKVLRNQLFGVAPSDPLAWLGAGAVLLIAGTLASYLPARRATNVDPIIALRSQ